MAVVGCGYPAVVTETTKPPPSGENSAVTRPAPALKSDDMREADMSNGENPDGDLEAQRDSNDDASVPHLAGQRQAAINAENNPPA